VTIRTRFDAYPCDHLSFRALDVIVRTRLVYLELGPTDAAVGLKIYLRRAGRIGLRCAGDQDERAHACKQLGCRLHCGLLSAETQTRPSRTVSLN
jgi:hypothetical protein